MNKPELETQAEKICVYNDQIHRDCFVNGYVTGALKREQKIADLGRENRLLGERCNQLLKDKGELTDQIADIKANCDLAIEGRDIKIKELELELTVEKDQHQEEINLHLHAEDYIKSLEEENTELKKKCYKKAVKDYCELEKDNAELKKQIEEMKCCVASCCEGCERLPKLYKEFENGNKEM